MLIAIISDIHDNLINLDKALNYIRAEKIGTVICCGDITNSETLEHLVKNYKKEIYLVRGNVALWQEKELNKFPNIKYLGRYGTFKIKNKIIGVCHEPSYINILEQEDCNIIFYGHTHKPWFEERNGVKIVNPGEVSGTWNKATFAVWDTESDNLELKLL